MLEGRGCYAENKGGGVWLGAVINWLTVCRTVTIHLDGVSRTVAAAGLPQGSALSPIIYAESEKSCGFGWIDDLNLIAWGKTVSDAVTNLRTRIPQLEAWSASHKSRFEPTKSDLVIFLPPSKSIPPNPPPLHLNGTAIPYSSTLTMLGTVLDSRLTFDAHVAQCAAKSFHRAHRRKGAPWHA
ncbi:hypothetical protein JCM8097_004730 [Rhodosporidiobolus ruineniae]